MRYRLRTLLILLAIGPPVLAAVVPPILSWLRAERLTMCEPLITEAGSWDRRLGEGGDSYTTGWDGPYERGDSARTNSIE